MRFASANLPRRYGLYVSLGGAPAAKARRVKRRDRLHSKNGFLVFRTHGKAQGRAGSATAERLRRLYGSAPRFLAVPNSEPILGPFRRDGLRKQTPPRRVLVGSCGIDEKCRSGVTRVSTCVAASCFPRGKVTLSEASTPARSAQSSSKTPSAQRIIPTKTDSKGGTRAPFT